jgi:hypothetical protein
MFFPFMHPITRSGGKVVGFEKDVGTRTELISPGGKVLGYHNKEKNQTILPGGRLFGLGDQTKSLLADNVKDAGKEP